MRAPLPIGRTRSRNRRGQMVLLAGVVVALALVAMLVAFLQLGYHADVETAGVDRDPIADGQSSLQRATHEASRALRGEYDWSDRDQAVTSVRNRLGPRLEQLQRSQVSSGTVYTAEFNQTAASQWAGANCPSGAGREFGPCEADRGVVVQERNDRTLVLAVGYDLNVTRANQASRLTVVSPAIRR